MILHAIILALGWWRKEDQEFRFILSYVASTGQPGLHETLGLKKKFHCETTGADCQPLGHGPFHHWHPGAGMWLRGGTSQCEEGPGFHTQHDKLIINALKIIR